MNELTENNHFKFGYNNRWFNYKKWFNEREDRFESWDVKYGRCKREPYSFRVECEEAAKLIRSKTDLPINIFFSGGIDSEVVCRSFMKAGIDFTPVICEYNEGLNNHDIKYALGFCRKFGLEPKILKLDVKEYWKDCLNLSEQTRCISPQFLVLMWMVSQVEGYNILGSGECYLEQSDYRWKMVEKEKVAALYKHYILNDIQGAPGFFQYTPELMLSYLEHPAIVNANSDPPYSLKPRVYENQWFGLKKREKYNGFEHLKELDMKYRQQLERKYPLHSCIHETPYQKLIYKLAPVTLREVSRDFVLGYKEQFEEENMFLNETPFENEVDLKLYYAAYVRDEVAGFGMLDIFKDRQSVYSHGSLTLKKFRGLGINNILLNHRYEELMKRFNNPNMLVMVITPYWVKGGEYQENKFIRRGFNYGPNRPNCGKILSCKLGKIKDDV
jgi:hypothetical protein